MADAHDRDATVGFDPHGGRDPRGGVGVEGGGGFVQQQGLRAAGQSLCEEGPLLLTSGEGAERFSFQSSQVEAIEGRIHCVT